MLKKDLRKALLTLCFMWLVAALHAQYTVRGGDGTPLMAHEDTAEKLEVYLMYGMSNVSISYTSSSTSHQWYRYKVKRLEAEKVSSTQNGTTSTIQNVEPGYGYFVEEGAVSHYVWIIDYSKYLLNISNLHISVNSDVCSSLLLAATGTISKMYYNTPNTGIPYELKRSFDVIYNTLEYEGEKKQFVPKQETKVITGNLFENSIPAPYCDTDICVKGDYFARHFGKEQTLCVDDYEAVAVYVEIDTVLIEQEAPNMNTSKEGYCAPATVQFTAIANTPTAALFNWKIYRKDDEEQVPIVISSGEEIDYTFNQAGTFIVKVEVSDRSTTCSAESEVEIQISESYLMIPNAFSPGATPGINDEFKVAYKSLINFRGWIFNRWGLELFRWTDPAQGWDGKKGGKYVSPGVYFYVIEAEGSDGVKYKKKGDINILRPKTIREQNESIEK